jgi:septum formation protein
MPPALWLAQEPLVLASRSKARQMLLTAAGVPVETCPADLNERGLEAQADLQFAGAVAVLLARGPAV